MQLNRIQQEYEKKELSLRLQHSQELERVQHQADNELREVYQHVKRAGFSLFKTPMDSPSSHLLTVLILET